MTDLLALHSTMPASGVDLTPLPYPLPLVPPFKDGAQSLGSRYQIKAIPTGHASGFYRRVALTSNPLWVYGTKAAPLRRLTMMDLEAYSPHIAAAHGHVVCQGFGMGVMAFNLLMKEEVTHVTVFDDDPHILKLTGLLEVAKWPNAERKHLTIRHGKALNDYSLTTVIDIDYLFVEGELPSTKAIALAAKSASAIRPVYTSWLGMELDYIEWLEQHRKDSNIDAALTELKASGSKSLMAWAEAANKYHVDVRAVTRLPYWGGHAFRAVKNVTIY